MPKGTYCTWEISTEPSKYYSINIGRENRDDYIKIVLKGEDEEDFVMDTENDSDGYFQEQDVSFGV